MAVSEYPNPFYKENSEVQLTYLAVESIEEGHVQFFSFD